MRDNASKTGGQLDNLDEVMEPIVDVNSQEEKLCSARLSIVLNAYGDLCGMTTLGALEIGGQGQEDFEEDSNGYDNGLQMAQGYDI